MPDPDPMPPFLCAWCCDQLVAIGERRPFCSEDLLGRNGQTLLRGAAVSVALAAYDLDARELAAGLEGMAVRENGPEKRAWKVGAEG